MVPLLLAAVLALTAVAVADRVEQRLVAPAVPAADVSSPDAAPEIADAPVAAPLPSQTPLTSAALPAGEMVLTFADGSAAISTGANEPIVELGTTAIGDLDLSGIDPVLAQGDGEVSADWGDVTEWYRAAGEGVEHGYTVDVPVASGDELRVTVDVVAGEPSLVDGQTVAIERDGASIVWYRGLFAFDANGADLPAEMFVVDGDIELQVDTGGAEYPITIDPIITDSQQLLPVFDASGDRFGESVAIDGVPGDLTIVVGAVGDRNGQGAAYVFHNDGSGWVQQAKLFAPTPGVRQFGWDVDVRGDIVVVGDPGDDENGTNAGAVFVFEPTGPSGEWQQTSVVYQCDPSVASPCGDTAAGTGFDGAGFGFAVDLTDQFLLVGAPRFQNSAGGAWVYQQAGSDWQTSTAGVIAGTQPAVAGDEFGSAIAGADAGTHIVVGAPGYDSVARIDAGRTFYLQWDGSALSAPVGLLIGNEVDGNAGASVEVEIDSQGDAWIFSGQPVNTRFEDGTETGDSFAWRNVLPAGSPPSTGMLSYGSSAGTPARVAFTGTNVLYADELADGSATDAGRVLRAPVLPDDGSALNRVGTRFSVSLPANAGDRWGFDVAAVGDTYVIGGPGSDAAGADAGEVRVGSFSSFGALEVLSPEPDVDPRRLGAAVALDGNRMAASAPFADVGAPGAGVVYVYDRATDTSPWVLASVIASPNPELNGGFGDSLDLRGDRLAIGESDRFRPVAEQEGRVWVFELNDDVWSQLGGWIDAFGNVEGNLFGASIAWTSDDRLAIGAPGPVPTGTGAVWVADFVDGETGWNRFELSTTNGGFSALGAGDQLGFAVAFDDSTPGVGQLVAGAPGASRRYSWTVAGADAIGNPGVAQFDAAWNMGSAVDISGVRVVTAGISDRLRVNVNEASPIQQRTRRTSERWSRPGC